VLDKKEIVGEKRKKIKLVILLHAILLLTIGEMCIGSSWCPGVECESPPLKYLVNN
jgi:hypothetical protein